jgi:hypothetical protein
MRHTRKTNGGVSFATPEDVVRRHTKGCRSPPHERMSEVTPSDGDLPHRGR